MVNMLMPAFTPFPAECRRQYRRSYNILGWISEGPPVMRWTAPTTGMAIRQNAVAVYEPLEGEPPMREVATWEETNLAE